MSIQATVTKEIDNLGDNVTVYNATQTTDTETAYASLTDDDFLDGSNAGTVEVAVIFPVDRSKDQDAEGQLSQGEMEGIFKYSTTLINKSLVKINSTQALYKVSKIDELRTEGELSHYEVILTFLRVIE